MKELKIRSTDNYELSLNLYETKKPKAIIQVIHGMEEHQDRYKDFATYLSKQGFMVVTSDMRGHGKNAKELGYFKDKGGYKQLIEDQLKIRDYIQEHYNGTPVYLFGHSMGTMISRVLLQKNSKRYDKVVLCGYPNYQSAAGAGVMISALIRTFKGPKYDSKLLQNMTTGSFNYSIENPKTKVDWLSYNEENVQKYINDPLCGFNFTVSAYNDLFHLLKQLHKAKAYKDINPSLPFLMIAGTDDPCTGGKKGTASSIATLQKAGFKNITRIDYENMRHEILNEDNKEQVYKDVVEFLNK